MLLVRVQQAWCSTIGCSHASCCLSLCVGIAATATARWRGGEAHRLLGARASVLALPSARGAPSCTGATNRQQPQVQRHDRSAAEAPHRRYAAALYRFANGAEAAQGRARDRERQQRQSCCHTHKARQGAVTLLDHPLGAPLQQATPADAGTVPMPPGSALMASRRVRVCVCCVHQCENRPKLI